ncbi:MAG: hypothetical protein WCW34_05480 [Patescibacteria group bacterium]
MTNFLSSLLAGGGKTLGRGGTEGKAVAVAVGWAVVAWNGITLGRGGRAGSGAVAIGAVSVISVVCCVIM